MTVIYDDEPLDDAAGRLLGVADTLAAAITGLQNTLAAYDGQRPWGDAAPGAEFGRVYAQLQPLGVEALWFSERQLYYTGLALASAAAIVRQGKQGHEEIIARLADYVPALASDDPVPADDAAGAP